MLKKIQIVEPKYINSNLITMVSSNININDYYKYSFLETNVIENDVNIIEPSLEDSMEEIIEDTITEEELLKQKEQEYCDVNGMEVPNYAKGCKSYCKTYMPYTAVTDKSSKQYALLNSDAAWTNKKTGLRMIDDRICIAVGTGYCSKIGTKIDVVMESGDIVRCILGDVKADRNTDSTHRYHNEDGSVVEMIMDWDYFYGTEQYPSELDGRVSKIVIINDDSF